MSIHLLTPLIRQLISRKMILGLANQGRSVRGAPMMHLHFCSQLQPHSHIRTRFYPFREEVFQIGLSAIRVTKLKM